MRSLSGFLPRLILPAFMAACGLFGVETARADGLFYRLPSDGSSATYAMEISADDRTMSGTMTMSSVGSVKHNDEPARWIEVKLAMKDGDREEVIVAKTLILEKHLKRGENPFANFIKCYQRHGDGDVREVKDVTSDDAGPLPAFLSGPFDDAKELPAAETESALGKLECAGVTGKLTIPQGDNKVQVEFENRLHDKSPFGVVTCTMNFAVERDGEAREKGTIKLKLSEIGMGAKSALPDSQ